MPHREKENGNGVRPAAGWSSREAYLLALVCLMAGLVVGYMFGTSSPRPATVGAAATSVAASAGAPVSLQSVEQSAAPLLAAIKADPKNVEALIQLGNLYYDHQAYAQAIEYYGRALELRPNDVNVRTDRGTAYWYSGFPEKALAEYDLSLAVNPTHAQTLFNLGVVRRDGMKDPAGAIAAWEKMLAVNPQHPDRARIQEMIAQTRSR